MQTRLKEVQVLGGSIRQGHIIALGEGNILVDAAFTESPDKVQLTRGRVLGGGVAQIHRNIGLVVRKDESSIRMSTLIGSAINNRFHTFDHGKKVGVATPKRDNFLELAVPSRYQHNIWRFLRVVRAIPLRESPTEQIARIKVLEQKLAEPTTAYQAAIQLEAIGKEAVSVLKKGLESQNHEIRFHAAEALAYLDESNAAPALAEAARVTPEFRWSSEMALLSMDHVNAWDSLNELLHVPSAEARYGAFRAIRKRNARDPLVAGQNLGPDGVTFHIVNTSSEPMVHFAKSQHPEIVLFGAEQRLKPPAFLYAGKQILVKREDDTHVKVVRYEPGKDDRTEICSTELNQIVPVLFKQGANYTDVMQCLLRAKKDGYLESRIAIDALPKPGRIYYRDQAPEEGSGEDEATKSRGDSEVKSYDPDFNKFDEEPKKKSFLGKMISWEKNPE